MVRITGSLKLVLDPLEAEYRADRDATVDVRVSADPGDALRARLPMSGQAWKDCSLDLSFASDGRLTGAAVAVEGVGPQIVETGVRLAAIAGVLAAGAVGGPAAAMAATAAAMPAFRTLMRVANVTETEDDQVGERRARARPLERQFAEAHPDLGDRRLALRDALGHAQDQLVTVALTLQDGAAQPAQGEVTALADLLEALRVEADALEAVFDAWRARAFPDIARDFRFEVATDELDRRAAAPDRLLLELDDLPGPAGDAARTLGVWVCRVNDADESRVGEANGLDGGEGIWFRLPRPVRLAVYRHDESRAVPDTDDDPELEGRQPFVRTSLERIWVVDRCSDMAVARFNAGLFDKRTVALEFGATGAPSRIAATDAGDLGRMADAGGRAVAAIEEAVKAGQALSALGDGPAADHRLLDLKRQADSINAEITLKGLLAGRAQHEQLARVKLEAELVKARKEAGLTEQATAAIAASR
ncbi:MAG: hypothetical protein M3417_07115 [Actinomycetota bacterium]|nr:hypothetical protein [Actinomycetota bacterium]